MLISGILSNLFPFVDGYIWSKPPEIAGLRFKALVDGKEILIEGADPEITDAVPGKLHIVWPLKSFEGELRMNIDERQIEMKLVANQTINWFLDLSAAGVTLPFTKITPRRVDCHFEGMNYSVGAVKGSFSKPENGSVLRIAPEKNTVILNFSGLRAGH